MNANLRNKEWKIVRADGNKCVLNISTSIVASDDGILHFLALMQDITLRKQVEKDKEILEARNRQIQKTESLHRMTGAMAHHFNNQLGVVIGYLELVMYSLRDKDVAGKIAAAMEASEKAAELSRLLLTSLGQSFDERKQLDLSEACRRGMPIQRAVIPGMATLKTDFPVPGPAVYSNEAQVQAILSRLLANAWEALGNCRRTIGLKVSKVTVTDIPAENRFPIDWRPREGEYACIEVTDQGCGIARDHLTSIFDPLFTSKFTGRGLGLPVVLGIAKAHGGAVAVQSEPEMGSTFRVFLPQSATPGG
jgi:signal transduction histidine kinase